MSLVFAPPAAVTVPCTGGGAFPVHRVYCVGRNYLEHAQEMGHSGREPPFFFMKPADALVPVPEGETGVIRAADAPAHLWGYAVGLDMTRRDLQNEMKKQGRPWEIGKAFEQSAPIGPVRPMAQCGELLRGAITLAVNGAPRQKGDLADLIWSVNETIERWCAAT